MLINKNTSGNFSFETGINYKYQWLNKSMHFEGAFSELIIKYNTNILEIPVKVKYYPFNKSKSKFLFYFTGGITNSFFFREALHYVIGGNSTRYNRKSYSLIANLGIGCQYKVNKRVGVIFETYYGYSVFETLLYMNKNLDFKTGVAYHF